MSNQELIDHLNRTITRQAQQLEIKCIDVLEFKNKIILKDELIDLQRTRIEQLKKEIESIINK
jgi:hypothetical protein